ncbi:40S Ribosomal protein S27 [Carpediemonas membranifera]|uniref:40S ribosomal protein S27 n=1 Tax=Carpediemonas membranifera TaxID=201153 RepID=A0A8J6BUW0_9EUKA|nr:40S Ribosomal protein S27 [Carpediemonas membranifera]|eukprot:KAG9390771.1 40S Ribosomal protein S27 [Carpediemonas membranifera]
MAYDLLRPTEASEKNAHKLKRLVQSPNSYFMDVKCPHCIEITTVFSHATTPVACPECGFLIATPAGGKAKLGKGCEFRVKSA